jgi:hypothetical protein
MDALNKLLQNEFELPPFFTAQRTLTPIYHTIHIACGGRIDWRPECRVNPTEQNNWLTINCQMSGHR